MADEKKPLHRRIPIILITAFIAGLGGYLAERATFFLDTRLAGPALTARVLNGDLPAAEFPVYTSAMLLDEGAHVDILGAPDATDTWREMSFEASDIATTYHKIRIKLRSRSELPVLIEAVTPRITERSAPLGGIFIAHGGCGLLESRKLLIDFDESRPSARLSGAGEGNDGAILYVSDKSVEVLDVMSYTNDHYVGWVLDISYSGSGGTGMLTVDNDGAPFRPSSEIGGTAHTINWTEASGLDLVRLPEWDSGSSMC